MSWSVNAVGKPSAVMVKLANDFGLIHCQEPEESIRQSIARAIANALALYPPASAVRVEASGSQHAPDHTKPQEKINSLRVLIEPVHGFIE